MIPHAVNEVRRKTWSWYPLPKVVATKMPQLDPMMKVEALAGAKAYDKELVKIQSFVLGALAPLTLIIDRDNRRDTPFPKEYREATLAAAELLGNANTGISCLRREKVAADANRALLPIAQEDDNFLNGPPYLFGNEFVKRSKDYVEQVRAMRSTLLKGTRKRPFFEWVAIQHIFCIPGLRPIPSGLLLKHSSFLYGTAVSPPGRGSSGWGLHPLTLSRLIGYLPKSFLLQIYNSCFVHTLCVLSVLRPPLVLVCTFVSGCLRLRLFPSFEKLPPFVQGPVSKETAVLRMSLGSRFIELSPD